MLSVLVLTLVGGTGWNVPLPFCPIPGFSNHLCIDVPVSGLRILCLFQET